MFRRLAAVSALLFAASVLPAAAPDFDRTVAPILTACLDCHTGADAKAKLDLSRKQSATAALDEVWRRVDANEMPPKKPLSAADKANLKAWIDGGAVWGTDPIDPLAHTTGARAGRDWWALSPVKRPAVPSFKFQVSSPNPVDAFILSRLEREGLKPSPAADRRTLLRRLKFDLLGLPPTPEEVDEFERDTAPDAYEKRVETYLASPQYGERWARHWLDAVRFAESHGYETNTARANAWPYRDWVIKALNADKPYDRFVFEQLAGDTVGADAATGFLVAGPWDAVKSPDPVLTANQRADELHDIVSTVGSTFLGLTVGCARCHAHKFDPLSQFDYYRLKAVFAGVQHGEREVRTGDQIARARRVERTRTELATLDAVLTEMEPLADPAAVEPRRRPVSARMNVERFRPVTARFVRMVILATSIGEPCLDEFEVFTTGDRPRNVALASAGARATSAGDYPDAAGQHKLSHVHDGRYGNSRSWISNTPGRGRLTVEFPRAVEIDRVVWGRDRDEQFADRLATRYRIDVSLEGEKWQVVASSDDRAAGTAPAPPPGLSTADRTLWRRLSEQHADARARLAGLMKADMAYVGKFTPPEPTHRLHRGDPMEKREVIAAGVLAEVNPKLVIPATATDAERRVAVARWITDPANPLTARVLVNRLWQHHFGTGLVATPSDFGFNGGRPTHPELLDWLAAELVAPLSPGGRGARGEGDGVKNDPLTPDPSPARGEGNRPWSLKHLHRLIVTSATYRQASAANPAELAKDAGSRLLWRYPPRRLEAEAIRDSVLAVSGKLDLTPGGPGFDLFEPNTNYVKVYTPKKTFGPAEFRRMIYQNKPRMQLDDTFGAFDCPDAGQIAPKRNASATPLQALNLLNSPFVVQQAGFLAERVKGEVTEPAGQVRRAFRLAFQREPTEPELTAGTKLATEHGLAAVCRALLNANEFLYVD